MYLNMLTGIIFLNGIWPVDVTKEKTKVLKEGKPFTCIA